MTRTLCFFALILLCLPVVGRAGAATTRVVPEMPDLRRNVSHVNAGNNRGMAWRWTASGGRRDMGQVFEVTEAFEARELALLVEAGVNGSQFDCPFRLSFFDQQAGKFPQGDPLAVFEGKIPPKGPAPRKGSWVTISFAPLLLQPGRYAFLLEFLQEGTDGQALTLAVGERDARAPGPGFFSSPGNPGSYEEGFPLNFILSDGSRDPLATEAAPAETWDTRVLVVDQKAGHPFPTIASAVKEARPGDTIRLEKGSGPYREVLAIGRSGTSEQPIIFDGSGEIITGFDPLEGFQQLEGGWTCVLPVPFPCVLTYRGERLVQDAATGQFTKWARLSDDGKRLVLLPGTETSGWEISRRDFVVQILNVSHHRYQNIRATGSNNDGFNLHGSGTGLAFERIEAFHNLDEGFSAHDRIVCSIAGGKFWGNDNGIGNVADSQMNAKDILVFSNLGWGLWLRDCTATLTDVEAGDNGAAQICFDSGSQVTCRNVRFAEPGRTSRPWLSYKESRKAGFQPAFLAAVRSVVADEMPSPASLEQMSSR